MRHGPARPGDLVIISCADIIESFNLKRTDQNQPLYGVIIELLEEDPDDSSNDVWVVLLDDQLWRMLRWEFDLDRCTRR